MPDPDKSARRRDRAGAVIAAIIVGGLVAGTLDIFVAAAINHVGPGVILQAIASGLLGKAAFKGGGAAMGLGLALQWLMSLAISAIYNLAAAAIPVLSRRPAILGVLYGVGVYLVMNFIVVPLSATWPRHHPTARGVVLNLAAMIVFGLIVALTPRLLGSMRRRDNQASR